MLTAQGNNNLNIQENLIAHGGSDDDVMVDHEDENSERYTFGCVTPKGDGEEVVSIE